MKEKDKPRNPLNLSSPATTFRLRRHAGLKARSWEKDTFCTLLFSASVDPPPHSFLRRKDPFVTSPGAWDQEGVSWAAEGREADARFAATPRGHPGSSGARGDRM